MPKRHPETGRFVSADDLDGGEQSQAKETREFLKLALERFQMSADAEAHNRREALDDLNFYIGEQWPADLKERRNRKRQPCLTINRLPQFKKQISNNLRQQRPAIQVNPAGDGVVVEESEIMQGVVRHIEVGSEAEVVYDMGADSMIITGLGIWRVVPEYEPGDSFKQIIKLKGVKNRFMVYDDPRAIEPDRSDRKFLFIIVDMLREDFKQQHENAAAASLEDFSSVGDNAQEWLTKERVRVAEYFYVEEEKQTIYLLADGRVVRELQPGENAVKTRERMVPAVKWSKITAVDRLEDKDIPCDFIPVVTCLGEDLDVNGKTYQAGMVRNAKDAQREVNYWESAATHMLALAPKSPYLVAEGQLEDHEATWGSSNIDDPAFLTYKRYDEEGRDLGQPTRNAVEQPIQGIALMMQKAGANLQSTTGIPDANLGERRPDESGKSVLLRKQQGDMATFDYSDNWARGIRFTGRILLSMIPRVMDVTQIQRIIKPDGTSDQVIMHAGKPEEAQALQKQNPAITRIFDVSAGRYDVTISVGPSFQTKRQEAVASIMSLIQAAPPILSLVGDLLAGNMDWNNAPEIAKRLKLWVYQQNPWLAQSEGDSPELQQYKMQAENAAMKQQMGQVTQALQEAQQIIATKKVETDGKIAVEKLKADADVLIAKMRALSPILVAEINTKAQSEQVRAEIDADVATELHNSAHELSLQKDQQGHDHTMADKNAAIASNAASQQAVLNPPAPAGD